jgi:LysR family glycine cleavage system transcriptional activator
MSDILSSMPLAALRVFEAAARLRSFTRAADELGVTQAAVSWQVKALEARLGQPLFIRLPREVAPTPAGERLARAASEALSILRSAISDLVETEEGVLAVTTVQSMGAQWLAPRLGGFQIAHPKIAVRLDASSRVIDLAREPVDLALRGGKGQWPGLTSHFLLPAVQTPLCAPGLLAQLGGFKTPADLIAAPRIGSDGEWREWFEAAGVEISRDRAVLRWRPTPRPWKWPAPWPDRAWPWARRSSSPRRSRRVAWSCRSTSSPAITAATGWPIPPSGRGCARSSPSATGCWPGPPRIR